MDDDHGQTGGEQGLDQRPVGTFDRDFSHTVTGQNCDQVL